MADQGHKLTDEALEALEKRLYEEYEQAAKETQEKLDKYMKKFTTKDAIWKKSVEAGLKTQEEYDKWRLQAIAAGERWEKMKDRIVADQLHVNQIAREIMDNEMPSIFELNANFALYQVEHDAQIDTSLTLYNREAVGQILRDDPDLLLPPGRRVSQQIQEGKAKRWERQKIQSVMTQGILQGESIPKLASRLASAVADSDYKAAVRNARTMATNAQNAGRYDAYNRLTNNGVELTLEWAATLDNRTRHEHRLMHGQRRNVGEPFEVSGVKIMYPAQTGSFMSIENAPQELIWNCRCTILAFVKGYEHDTIKHSDKMGKMTFEEWLEAKPKPQNILHQKNRGDELEQDYIKGYRKMNKEADEILAGRKETVDLNKTLADVYERRRLSQNLHMTPYEDIPRGDMNPIQVDLKKLNEKAREQFENVISKLSEKYDTSLMRIRTMTPQEALGNTAFATSWHTYSTGSAEMIVNPIKFGDYGKMISRMKELVTNGYIPRIKEGTEGEYVATHEFAHTLINMQEPLSKSKNWVDLDLSRIRAARKEISKIYDEYKQEVKDLEKEFKKAEYDVIMGNTNDTTAALRAKERLDAVRISRYSLESSDEFMADSFVQVQLAEKQSPYARRVVDVLNKYYGVKNEEGDDGSGNPNGRRSHRRGSRGRSRRSSGRA